MIGKQPEEDHTKQISTEELETWKQISCFFSMIFAVLGTVLELRGDHISIILFIICIVCLVFSFSKPRIQKLRVRSLTEEEIYKNLCAENDARDAELNRIFEEKLTRK
jgi:hypothetical protein